MKNLVSLLAFGLVFPLTAYAEVRLPAIIGDHMVLQQNQAVIIDIGEGKGFAVCGAGKVWHWATGAVVENNDVVVSSPEVAVPIAIRYAWADNPVCNLYSSDGLPVTPFRSDDFEMIPKPKE